MVKPKSVTHIKIAICGNPNTGKKTFGTTFHQREIMDKKEENSNRYTISNECLDIEFLYIQPSAGSSFEDVQPEDIPWYDIDAFILFYAVDEMNSFTQMQVFHRSFDVLQKEEKNTYGLLKPCICIGNKCDTAEIVREVPLATAMKFSDTANAPYFETSAKTGKNVSAVIEDLIKQILRYRKQKELLNTSKNKSNPNLQSDKKKTSFFRSRRDVEDDDLFNSNA
ncbi:hypothetical protein FDP41_003771 [Naegleria fowleri]|uniref:Uncharacterized protein n=1 Tax=Naegleria fowleri TaxID=5763 RepID=A0A6A5BSX3_NAEFO|nr:uncharacterized protein FDP41_003771 [Naegleria fowleri]KAF0977118.1 hypothetical protein FDP41_003771 [Naegleria fowleri]